MQEEPKKSKTAEREEAILSFWNKENIFEKSLEKPSPKGEFVFYDGPPFATGLPHYGHLLAGTIKDTIPRYKTMRGYHVRRRWGWDTHGLPLENEIEKELGLKNKKDIEELGVKKFNSAARNAVLRYADEWKKIVPRFGRWVDMEDDYRTMDSTYTETIWWIFSELWKKGLVYEGFKSMHLCSRCGTTLSNFEVAQGYKDITDFAVTVKLELVDEPGTYLLVWTTTPWTLPGNMAAAVKHGITYVAVRTDDGLFYVAKERTNDFFENPIIEREVQGSELVGKVYTPPFAYYLDKDIEHKQNAWRVYAAEYVTAEDGTGIVHLAPAFGAEDLELAQKEHIPVVHHVNKEGVFTEAVTDFKGMYAKPKEDPQSTDVAIIKHLAHAGTLFKKEKIVHNYPHCWRCDTPLLNYATTSWFVEVTKIKDRLVTENKKIQWVPREVGEKRFGNWLENVRDWSVSRARYWGAPIPVWKDAKGNMRVVDSLKELTLLTKKSGNAYYTMRHGDATSNVERVISADQNEPNHLTELGREQVEKEAEKLKGKNIDLIICSPFVRTRETAEILQKTLKLDTSSVIYDEQLSEYDHGDFNGKRLAEWREVFPKDEKATLSRFVHGPKNGESLNDLRKRVGDFLYNLEEKYQNKNIVIVSHGEPLWMLHTVAIGAHPQKAVHMPYPQRGVLVDLPFVPLPHNTQYELDFHRPYIDEIQLVDEKGEPLTRVLDVFDCWFESGSMPLAQQHYPFEHTDIFEPKGGLFKKAKGYPADFIAEGLDQTRGWFYSLLVLGAALFGKSPYKNVIVNGTILAGDGQKMSKRLKNYPDPMEMVHHYGADAVRYYLLASPVVRGEDLSFAEKDVAQVKSKLIDRLMNVYEFYALYKDDVPHESMSASEQVLDEWIIARLHQTHATTTKALDAYELDRAARPLAELVDDLSVWYVRRSRDRFKSSDTEDKARALYTTRFVLRKIAKLYAPFMPFFAEWLWQRVRRNSDPESVHLVNWCTVREVDNTILKHMRTVRECVSHALELRAKEQIKVRQPLASVTLKETTLKGSEELLALIKDEVNIKDVLFDVSLSEAAVLDTNITPQLKEEGDVRELLREIQDLRKKAALAPKDMATLVFSGDTTLLEKHWDELKHAANLTEFTEGTDSYVEKS